MMAIVTMNTGIQGSELEQNEKDLEILISPDLLSKEMKHPPCPNSECSWTKTLKCELFLYILESACNKFTCFHVLLYF